MKRTISLLLALVMVFALCGCGSKNETVPAAHEPKADQTPPAEDHADLIMKGIVSLPIEDEYFDVESAEFRIKPLKDGNYQFDIDFRVKNKSAIKAKNLYIMGQLLDNTGNTIELNLGIMTHDAFPNQSVTASTSLGLTEEQYSKLYSFRFISYSIRDLDKGINDEYDFTGYPELLITDYLAK